MKIDRRALKARAREAMRRTSPSFWAVALLYLLLTTGVQLALSLAAAVLPGESGGLFLNILFYLYSMVIQFGLRLWSLWAWRRQDPGAGALVQGFSIPGRVVVMELLILLRILGWTIGFAILLSPFLLFLTASPVLYWACVGAVSILIMVVMLRYSMAPYLLADRPDDGASLAIRRSVAMMRGRVWELFKLQLSFLGWQLVNWALSTGVFFFLCAQAGLFHAPAGMESLLLYQSVSGSLANVALSGLVTLPLSLWLLPYQEVAQAGFYEEVRQTGPAPGAPEMPPL